MHVRTVVFSRGKGCMKSVNVYRQVIPIKKQGKLTLLNPTIAISGEEVGDDLEAGEAEKDPIEDGF